ncbi:MAG: 6-carboxytetrahydropterin synthase [Methylococcaceae bacterium]|nr:6-carboxytetrahydropterin synthase [Methylococcaceae bacterium]
MIIRKLFSFEGAHIVRNCTTQRCARSIHGHSYKVEILLEADVLDNGQMVYDFGLMKADMRDIVDAFDHTLVFWNDDAPDYIAACVKNSLRWIGLPVSPSAEQLSRVFFVLIELALKQTKMRNGEGDIALHSIIVHETATSYAQCFAKDAHNPKMGVITRDNIQVSAQVLLEASTEILRNEQHTI